MRNFHLFLFVLSILLAYCSAKNKVTGLDLMPEMAQTDSLEIIYFRSPDETRYFSYLPVNDKSFINAVVKDVSGEVQPENPCLKEGKIYCYRNKEVFNTIYFAYQDENCVLFRYIKNGKLYYFKMSDSAKASLSKFKSLAREPVSNSTSVQQ